MTTALALLKHWRAIVVAAVALLVFAGGWYVAQLRAHADALKVQAAQAQKRADDNAEAADSLQAELLRRDEISKRLQQWQQQSADNYGQLRDDIRQQLQDSTDALRACAAMSVGPDLFGRLRHGAGERQDDQADAAE